MTVRQRIGVNLLWLVPGVVGGSEEYTVRLLTAIAERPPADIELSLFVLRPFVEEYGELAAQFPTDVCPLADRAKAVRIAAESSWLAVAARRRRCDLLHHAGGTIPFVRSAPAVVTVHDLQPLLLPDNSHGLVKRAYLHQRLPPSVRRSRLVITLTEYTRRTIIERFGVSGDHVVLAPPGYTSALVEEPPHDPAEVYDIDRPFFLYPAITYPHKNHVTLVRAFARVVDQGDDVLLVLTHRPDTEERNVHEVAASLGVADRIRRLGHVPRGDLDWLYRNAIALTFPSRFEGFGLPVLEAMGHGCPVIAADATALPEVVGESGVLVDPEDDAAWAAAMLDVRRDAARREWLVEAGLARVTEFRWSASADKLLDAYRRAAEVRS